MMFFSCVEEDAPALMSRHTMTTLDAIPDISTGKMIYRALGTTSQLYLSTCGHLAVRLDEWPEELPSWPCQMPLDKNELPDVWAPTATPVQARPLPSARHPAVTPPGDARSSFMAEALASAAGPPVEPGGDCEQVGAPLRRFELEATSARRHHQANMAPCTAATMQTSMAAMAAQANMQTLTYPRDPSECEHPSGLRAYGAGGQSVRICDQCGFRAVIHKGQMIRVQPKASPHARTPLQLPEHISQHSKSKAAGKASSKAAGKSAPPAKSTGSSGQQRSGSGPFLPFSQGYFSEPPQYPNLANMTPSQSWTHQQILQQQVEDQVQRRLQEIGPQVEAQVQQRLEQMAKAKATAPMPSTLTAPVPEIPLDNGSVASWDQVGSQWNQDWNNPSNWDQPYDWTEEIEEQHEDFENDQENYPDMGQEQMSLDGSAL